MITYDLPGFGGSDPHPGRNLNSSAIDMLHLADAVGVIDKFWVVGYSGGGKHAWAAVCYIPERLAGTSPFADVKEALLNQFSLASKVSELCLLSHNILSVPIIFLL